MYLVDILVELSMSPLKQLGMGGMEEWGWECVRQFPKDRGLVWEAAKVRCYADISNH